MKRVVVSTTWMAAAAAVFGLWAAVAFGGTVTDYDGNVYETVTIGTQVWTAENLKVNHYRNGDPIPFVVPDSFNWRGVTTGLSCAYNADSANVAEYGLLYNWYATVDPRGLAPTGWRVATDEDWKVLEVYLGMPEDVVNNTGYRGGYGIGAKLKEAGTEHWTCPNTGTTNETGFSGRGGGVLDNRPLFTELGNTGFIWTSTARPEPGYAWARSLPCGLANCGRNGFAADYGGSVRCVQDQATEAGEENGGTVPHGFTLSQNYPNPFNPTTVVEYSLPARAWVSIEIYNISGQRVRSLVNESQGAGKHRTEWDGMDDAGRVAPTGVYLYRLQAGDYEQTKKMVLVK